ncbi:Stk1 family PASTA domain-containing Ser/Thr kinase [Acetivibrio cellulolyticus]|uniref:Stk1 family PASTA domain-containing Ser/Thr kinase n=1 Tax=Acetivibrio cellulolyticus TaxID=35830 RepID=UPI0001E2D8D6|nr:Stk1 family PASTA domain-containing Ser/Thr kinase [Acetivibrio cellulolyticus]
MEGRILGGRYELIEKIGGGGMALVYKAKCKLLNRFVAIKLLRPEFTADEEFVKRFRVEAQAAASLSHPNIVSIYDVGKEDDMHYIVMEYVNGITLKDYIVQNGALDWKEAVNVVIQICSAIEHAHKNHIVHRDIKPHNILLTKDGIAKVTDFGIARAVTSSTITVAGSTIGSVHYFSPEQARGGFSDEKSDLYSLGIVLYELVTGRLPFNGESPVAIALKHIQDMPEEPSNIKKDLPKGVNDLIMTAIEKDQKNRYQSASEMLDHLYKVLKNPDMEIIIGDGDTVYDSPTVRIPSIGEKTALLEKDSPKKTGEDKMEKKRDKDKVTTILAITTSIIVIAVIGFILGTVIWPTLSEPDEYVVKDYTGMNYYEAKADLENNEIKVEVNRKNDEDVDKDVVLSQDVAKGTELKQGGYSKVVLTVSDGPVMITIKDLTNIDYREAVTQVESLGLVAKVVDEYSDEVAEGMVTRTEPGEGDEVRRGKTVRIYRSEGPEIKTTTVPDLKGRTKSEAKNLLAEKNLIVGKIYPEDKTNAVDKIIKQNPEPGESIVEGKPVDIYLEENIPAEGPGDSGNNNGNSGNADKVVARQLVLTDADQYGEFINVLVKITRSDTNTEEQLYSEVISKTNFPLTLSIPIPKDGSTEVKVFLNSEPEPYTQFTEQY